MKKIMKWLSDPRNDISKACSIAADLAKHSTSHLDQNNCYVGVNGMYVGLWILAYVPRILILLYFIKWLIFNRKKDTDISRRKLTHAFSFLQFGQLFTFIVVMLM